MSKKSNTDLIDIKTLLHDYLSHWYYFVISVIVCVGLAFLVSKIKQPTYGVRASVVIMQEDSNPLGGMGALGDIFGAKGNVDDEIFVISSHSLYRDVVRDLGINITHRVRDGFLMSHLAYPTFPLDLVPAPGILDTLRMPVSIKVKVNDKGLASGKLKYRRTVIGEIEDAPLPVTFDTPMGRYTLTATESFPHGEAVTSTITVMGYDAAAEQLALDVSSSIASKRSNAITLGIDTKNPDYGRAVLNEIITKYNLRGIAERNQQSQRTAEFIDQRLDLLARDLSEAESNIEDFKSQKGIIDVSQEASYQTTKRGRIENLIMSNEMQSEILKMTEEFIADPANAYELIPMSVENEGLQSVIETYNELIIQRRDLLESTNDNNETVRRLTARIDAHRANIAVTINRLYANMQSALRDLRTQAASVAGMLSQVPSQERQYIDLRRQQKVKQDLYVYLLQRREETAMLLANAVPKAQIVDSAYALNEPLGVSTKGMLIMAFVLGLCIPPLWFSARRMLRNKFDSRQEVEKITDAPILGEMCIDRTGNNLVVTENNTSSTAELFRLLRTNLLFVLNDASDKVVMVTSSSSGEGKSFISVNLAASLALLKKRVVLVGMDIRNPQLANYLNINPRLGLTQYLSNSDISLDNIIEPMDACKGLDVIVAGPVPPNPSELLASQRVDEVIAALRERYDYIIVDTAPIGLVSDTFGLNRIADATIFVCRVNYTSLNDMRNLADIYDQKRLRKLSVVVNGTTSKKNYTYGYGNKSSK